VRSVMAYLDPGSAGALIQILGGGIAALAVTLKLFWRRILHILHIRRQDDPTSAPPDGPPAP
jgi:hypothetical protein